MIRDKELAALFKAESDEHLSRLDELLLQLEGEPENRDKLEEVFREAHSLKGSARMVGERGIEAVAHRFEDALGEARRGDGPPSPRLFARLAGHVEAVRKLVLAAATGQPADVDLPALLADLNGGRSVVRKRPAGGAVRTATPSSDRAAARPGETALAATAAPPVPAGPVEPPPAVSEPSRGSAPAAQTPGFRISTIRVDPERLDALLTHSSELTSTRLRIQQRVLQLEELLSFWEDWSRDVAKASETGGSVSRRLRRAARRVTEEERVRRIGELLGRVKTAVDEDAARLSLVSGELDRGIHSLRLLPLSGVFSLFPRMVRDLSQQQEKEIELIVEGGDTAVDKRILEEIKDPLMHVIRNALDHGLETPLERERCGKPRRGTIRLKGYQSGGTVVIEVSDDGRGLDLDKIRAAAVKRRIRSAEEVASMSPADVEALIFASGFSTSAIVTDLSGRGVGMDVVRRNVENLKGGIDVSSRPGQGCTFTVRLPVTLATASVLVVKAGGLPFALPVEAVAGTRLVPRDAVFSMEGRETIDVDQAPLPVADLERLLELRAAPPDAARGGNGAGRQRRADTRPCVIVEAGRERIGVFVDALAQVQDVVLKPLCAPLERVRNVSGTTILGTGDVCTVLNPQDLVKSAARVALTPVARTPAPAKARTRVVLLAEDSITTRTQEKRILESAGYEVVTAVDGLDALHKLSTRSFDALVTDIQMPNLDGLALTERIRRDQQYRELPIILVTSLASDEDRKRGVEMGANAYLTKPAFDQRVLLETLGRFV